MKYKIKLVLMVFLMPMIFGEEMAMADKAGEGVYLIINFDVRPEKQAEFEEIMQGVSVSMQSEDGFEEAFVFLDGDNPNRFTLIERWTSRSLHHEHYERIVKSGDWAHILSLLKAEPELSYTRLFAR